MLRLLPRATDRQGTRVVVGSTTRVRRSCQHMRQAHRRARAYSRAGPCARVRARVAYFYCNVASVHASCFRTLAGCLLLIVPFLAVFSSVAATPAPDSLPSLSLPSAIFARALTHPSPTVRTDGLATLCLHPCLGDPLTHVEVMGLMKAVRLGVRCSVVASRNKWRGLMDRLFLRIRTVGHAVEHRWEVAARKWREGANGLDRCLDKRQAPLHSLYYVN